MIPVEFTIEPGTAPEEFLNDVKTMMPWLEYLIEKCYDMKYHASYDARTHLNLVRYSFYLLPKHETFYRVKFNSN